MDRPVHLSRCDGRNARQALLRDAPPPSFLQRESHADRSDRIRARPRRACARTRHDIRYFGSSSCRVARVDQGFRLGRSLADHAAARVVRLQARSAARRGPRIRRALLAESALRTGAVAAHRQARGRRGIPRGHSRSGAHVRRHLSLHRELAARLRARQPQLPDRRDRLHRWTASLRVHGRAARAPVLAALSGARSPSRYFAVRSASRIGAGRRRSARARMTSIAQPKRLTLAFTGASGLPYGLRLLECLIGAGVVVDLVYSTAAQLVARQECDLTLPPQPREATRLLAERYRARDGQLTVPGREDWLAPMASGSNPGDGMAIC